ncbi:hypothetical protein [Polaromonas sp. CG9_12]|nr:hypothetical protein [Polaromonas sp. CG9_12]
MPITSTQDRISEIYRKEVALSRLIQQCFKNCRSETISSLRPKKPTVPLL